MAIDAEDTPKGSETVLTVEDDGVMRMATLYMLASLGYKVIEAENGQEALKILEGPEQIDLLFTDIVMPGGVSGIELAKKAQTSHPQMKILFTTGYNPDELQGTNLGIPILKKPYRKYMLAQTLRKVLDQVT